MHPSLCRPSDQRHYEPGAGLCVSAGLLALWQRIGLQTVCLRPHTAHTSYAGGGRGQLLVVCIHFSLHKYSISVCVLICAQCAFVCVEIVSFPRYPYLFTEESYF